MERRAVVLCEDPTRAIFTHYDLRASLYPRWSASAGWVSVCLLQGVFCLALVWQMGAWGLLSLVVPAIHAWFWQLNQVQLNDGVAVVPRRGLIADQDASQVYHQMLTRKRQLWRHCHRRYWGVFVVDLMTILTLFSSSFQSTDAAQMLLPLLLLIAPSSLMIMAEYRRIQTLATTKTQLAWIPNVLGWSGIVRYDDEVNDLIINHKK